MTPPPPTDPERQRLAADAARQANWRRWGPYLSERQWATVREDYSPDNSNWTSFPYDHARSRAYRWGEDGLMGFTDRECRLCFAVALWNHADDHLKERLFGLTNPEGNHGEDVKEVYFYSDATPTYSYCRSLYKYPQAAFPYADLRRENARRSKTDAEYELTDTGVFDGSKYFDVTAEYAKAGPDDILITLTAVNRGPAAAPLTMLPTVWFRNTWSWGAAYDEGKWAKPHLAPAGPAAVTATHQTLGDFTLTTETPPQRWLFTENETDPAVFGGTLAAVGRALGKAVGLGAYTKGAFHRVICDGDAGAANAKGGTKAAAVYVFTVPAGGAAVVRLRLTKTDAVPAAPFADLADLVAARRREADQFYDPVLAAGRPAARAVGRQAYAGLLWSNQFYQYVVPDWVTGDKAHPNPPEVRDNRINRDWPHLFSRDVLSVPDKWEYPAFFSWDTAFHMVALARIDPEYAKAQLLVLLREWYLHPNGQLPAYEYDLSNVTPPVHAWACWQVYRRDGKRDKAFLERTFHKLLMNFTWWVNRKDPTGQGVFSGGFLGMDNIGVFDRSRPLPVGGSLEQADGTAWMGFYCTSMLQIALELARHNKSYEDVASKFFEHFVAIADSLNNIGGRGLWDDADGFYYDQLKYDGGDAVPLKLRGMIGFVPLFAVSILREEDIRETLPEFDKRMHWFITNRRDLLQHIGVLEEQGVTPNRRRLLSLPSRHRLVLTLGRMLDETEFLSPFGVRSLSKVYQDRPFKFEAGGRTFEVKYVPGDMDNGDFGGNSNWRGPVWLPMNYLIIESLREYHEFYGDAVKVECPVGSGTMLALNEVADELGRRVAALFLPVDGRQRPCHGGFEKFADDPHWKDHLLFHEYFHGDTGRGLGASHQTGWTALAATLLEECRDGM